MLCPNCHNRPAIEDHTLGVLPCEICQNDHPQVTAHPEFVAITKKDRIQRQRDTHEKDLIQPFIGKDWQPNPDFARAYKSRVHDYYTKEQLEKL